MSFELAEAAPAVRVDRVSKLYRLYDRPVDRLLQMGSRGRIRRFKEFWALKDISLSVQEGESFGIIGVNGSGKSTLLQIICGTLAPTHGTVSVNGRLSALLELGAGFNPEFTGLENVFLNATLLGLDDEEIKSRLDNILAFADIGDFVNQPVKTYSSGMFVRLAFAVAVHVMPNVLVVDEALAVGDNLFQKRCFAKLEELLNNGVTILFVSHDIETVRTLTSRVLVIEEGKAVYVGATAEGILEYRKLLHEKELRYLQSAVEAASKSSMRYPGRASLDNVDKGTTSNNVSDISLTNSKTAGKVGYGRLRFGEGTARVVSVATSNSSGRFCNVFYPGEELIIRIRVQILQSLSNLNVGIRIRNKQGIKIYSWGTLNQDISIWSGQRSGETFWDVTLEANTEIEAEFTCLNTLGEGFYEIQSYIAWEGDRHFQQQRILDWCDESAFFSVHLDRHRYFFGGICDMRMNARVNRLQL